MDTIGKYQLVRIIGEGGMGRVYEAIDPIIGRRVAVKTISLSVATDAETRSRFFREAQAAGQLSHPNLITIHDIGDAEGTPYIVMEFLEGLDLNRKMRQERLSYDAKMQIMIDVCEGLAFAHGRDIVHRDIKPANIFITPNGRAKILDFGLARGVLSDVTIGPTSLRPASCSTSCSAAGRRSKGTPSPPPSIKCSRRSRRRST
jgi:serine/threonine-protein kinase